MTRREPTPLTSPPKETFWILLFSMGAVALLASCGGGGGSSSSPDDVNPAFLLDDVTFLDPSEQTLAQEGQGPSEASLIQRVSLSFTAIVPIEAVTHEAIHLRSRRSGVPVLANFERTGNGKRLILTPHLPTREAIREGEDWFVDSGLQPGTEYELVVLLDRPEAMPGLAGFSSKLATRYGHVSGSLVIPFKTTENADLFWTGLEPRPPKLVDVSPAEGSRDVPVHAFSDDAWEPFRLEFDAPLHPSLKNLETSSFLLADLRDSLRRRVERYLAADVWIEVNELDRAVVRLDPIGLLPEGHRLGLEVESALRGLAEAEKTPQGHELVSSFDIQNRGSGSRNDVVREDFETKSREETSFDQIDRQWLPADWDAFDSNQLQAAFDFPGHGELGRFLPFPGAEGDNILILDTDRQTLPLLDGSTPDAPSDTVIVGGVFNFSSIRIPTGVRVVGRGSNPLILTATDNVHIAGTVEVDGEEGDTDLSFDQALAPLEGGLGGPAAGRGGHGHPSILDQGMLVSPRFGEAGAPSLAASHLIGGRPGEGGVYTATTVQCKSGRGTGGGGGGGSLYRPGSRGGNGSLEEHVTSTEKFDANGKTIWIDLGRNFTRGGHPGDILFRDSDRDNDFIGRRGEYRFLLGGQGGGGAGSRLDAFWCDGLFPGFPLTIADSRGGGGGGGGGALAILCLGTIQLEGSALLSAKGGNGGDGETGPSGNKPRGGGGGGGSGGMIRLMTPNIVQALSAKPEINVSGGKGAVVKNDYSYGGDGGSGLIQIQQNPDVDVNPSHFDIEPSSALVDPKLTPTEISSISVGQSKWINLGAGVFRDQGQSPTFTFEGIDEGGYVITDENGNQPRPESSDIRVDQLPVTDPLTGRIVIQGGKDRIPDNAWVKIEFQSAQAMSSDRDEVDEKTISAWGPSLDIADGRQLVRYRVIMNFASEGYAITRDLPLIAVRLVRLRFEY